MQCPHNTGIALQEYKLLPFLSSVVCNLNLCYSCYNRYLIRTTFCDILRNTAATGYDHSHMKVSRSILGVFVKFMSGKDGSRQTEHQRIKAVLLAYFTFHSQDIPTIIFGRKGGTHRKSLFYTPWPALNTDSSVYSEIQQAIK